MPADDYLQMPDDEIDALDALEREASEFQKVWHHVPSREARLLTRDLRMRRSTGFEMPSHSMRK